VLPAAANTLPDPAIASERMAPDAIVTAVIPPTFPKNLRLLDDSGDAEIVSFATLLLTSSLLFSGDSMAYFSFDLGRQTDL
jgi:hypothetical protein